MGDLPCSAPYTTLHNETLYRITIQSWELTEELSDVCLYQSRQKLVEAQFLDYGDV